MATEVLNTMSFPLSAIAGHIGMPEPRMPKIRRRKNGEGRFLVFVWYGSKAQGGAADYDSAHSTLRSASNRVSEIVSKGGWGNVLDLKTSKAFDHPVLDDW